MGDLTCPICKENFVKLIPNQHLTINDWSAYQCAVCGPFTISRKAEINSMNMDIDHRMSAWIRNHETKRSVMPRITVETLDEVLENLPKYSALEKQTLLLRAIELQTDYPGDKLAINVNTDYPLAWAQNSDEMDYLLKALIDRGFLHQEEPPDGMVFMIKPAGWEHLDQQASKPTTTDQAFVAMSFDKSMDNVWINGIKPAIERAGYKPLRVDKEQHIDRIDAKIIADIKDSVFVVADVTQQKQGVYFEAGYALGLNRPVIWTVNADDLNGVHFDTRQYNHIVWATPENLQEELYYRICAVIGKREA